jgi:hypothetical protein
LAAFVRGDVVYKMGRLKPEKMHEVMSAIHSILDAN